MQMCSCVAFRAPYGKLASPDTRSIVGASPFGWGLLFFSGMVCRFRYFLETLFYFFPASLLCRREAEMRTYVAPTRIPNLSTSNEGSQRASFTPSDWAWMPVNARFIRDVERLESRTVRGARPRGPTHDVSSVLAKLKPHTPTQQTSCLKTRKKMYPITPLRTGSFSLKLL